MLSEGSLLQARIDLYQRMPVNNLAAKQREDWKRISDLSKPPDVLDPLAEAWLQETEALLGDMPEGMDEYGVWSSWSKQIRPRIDLLLAEVRRLREQTPVPIDATSMPGMGV